MKNLHAALKKRTSDEAPALLKPCEPHKTLFAKPQTNPLVITRYHNKDPTVDPKNMGVS